MGMEQGSVSSGHSAIVTTYGTATKEMAFKYTPQTASLTSYDHMLSAFLRPAPQQG
jgi:hypothetical protein